MSLLLQTPLPVGYSTAALVLRRFLLDLQLRCDAIPTERKRMLERKVYELTGSVPVRDKNGNATYSKSNAAALAKAASR